MKKQHAWPEGHWDWPIKVSHKHGVRSGQMIWVGGQCDLTSRGEVRNQGDLSAQIPNVIASFGRVLEELGSGLGDLVKLLCFYVNDGSVDERAFLAMVGKALPPGARPDFTTCAIRWIMAYPSLSHSIAGLRRG